MLQKVLLLTYCTNKRVISDIHLANIWTLPLFEYETLPIGGGEIWRVLLFRKSSFLPNQMLTKFYRLGTEDYFKKSCICIFVMNFIVLSKVIVVLNQNIRYTKMHTKTTQMHTLTYT